jgi:hypothetical protein
MGGEITVEDLGSSNGTYVNGAQLHGEAVLAEGDQIQVGSTILTVHGDDAATAMLGPGGDPTQAHPGPAPAQPDPVGRQPRAIGDAVPRRLAPGPHEEGNIPALAAVFCGPLAIFLLFFSTSAAFFVSLPLSIAAVVLGTIGIRRVDRGQSTDHRTLAVIGRVTGIIGAVLSALALVAFLVVSIALDITEDSLDGVVEAIRDEIEGTDLPEVPDVQDRS